MQKKKFYIQIFLALLIRIEISAESVIRLKDNKSFKLFSKQLFCGMMIVMDCFFTFVKQETNCFSSFIIQNEIVFL